MDKKPTTRVTVRLEDGLHPKLLKLAGDIPLNKFMNRILRNYAKRNK